MSAPAAAVFDARVIAAFGRHVLLADAHGAVIAARPFGRRLSVVCGDRVRAELDSRHAGAHVVSVYPRASCLQRCNARGESEPVIANLSQLIVMLAPLPKPDLFVIDRYLCAAAAAGIEAALLLNKCELGIEPALRSQLSAFERAGYVLIECSAHTGAGIDAVLRRCAAGVTGLVGQSGVGKSSLLRRLAPQAQIDTGALVREEEGRHTTTASRLYTLPDGAQLIDSPGVRDFAPALETLEERSLGFVEIAALAGGCRFADCRHLREPDCAVRAAAECGALEPRRLESYRRLRRLKEQLTAARRAGRRR